MSLTEEQKSELKEHFLGEKDCSKCCCGSGTCGDCNGVAHALYATDEIEFSDGDWGWAHRFICDKCGKDWEA